MKAVELAVRYRVEYGHRDNPHDILTYNEDELSLAVEEIDQARAMMKQRDTYYAVRLFKLTTTAEELEI